MDGRIGNSSGSASAPVTTQNPNVDGASNQGSDTKAAQQPASKPGLPGTKDAMEERKPNGALDHMMKPPQTPAGAASGTQPGMSVGVMQFAGPKVVAGGAKLVLTDEQAKAKEQLQQSPAWKGLSEPQQTQIAKNLSRLKGDKLKQEVAKTQEQFKSIETLQGHAGWKALDSKQQEKVTGDILKLSGSKLKQETTDVSKKFDAIATMSGNAAWKSLSPAQQHSLTDPALKLTGANFKNHVDQSKAKLDSIASLAGQPSWGKLSAAEQQRAADTLLKVSGGNATQLAAHLKQATANVQGTVDFVASLKSNSVDSGKTLDHLLDMEAKNPKAYEKMATVLGDAQKQIDGSKTKQTTATDVRDMINLSVDRGVADRAHKDVVEAKTEIAKRFVKQYSADPTDFAATRDALKNTTAHLVVHWANSDKVGMDVQQGGAIPDAALRSLYTAKSIPAGQQTKYAQALQVLVKREGALDAINTYDTGIVSVGVRQWTTHQGSLAAPLREFQRAHPDKFTRLLPGVEVRGDEILYNGKSLMEGHGKHSGDLVGGLKQSEIAELTTKFHNLSLDPDFQAVQLSSATDRIDTIRNMRIGPHKIDDYIPSNRSLGHLVDFDANRPGWVNNSFSEAVQHQAADLGLKSATPSRSELLAGLKEKVEKDKDYQEKLKQRYGANILDQLKTDGGRSDFLEKRLVESFRDQFVGREANAAHAAALRNRYNETEAYYDAN